MENTEIVYVYLIKGTKFIGPKLEMLNDVPTSACDKSHVMMGGGAQAIEVPVMVPLPPTKENPQGGMGIQLKVNLQHFFKNIYMDAADVEWVVEAPSDVAESYFRTRSERESREIQRRSGLVVPKTVIMP